jgi:hypothetical protein
VKRWYGTNNNASTSVYNVVTMPAAAHAADVEYELACYSLATSHTGMGTDPAIDTVTSPYTCKTPGSFVNNGYNYLDPVQLANAVPDAGWSIGSWTGLGYASVLPNPVLSMPPTNHVVTVNYGTTCYALTLSYTGTGSAPTATPVKSVGCASDGQFYPGAAISLTAYPGAGFQVGSWLGTNNDASASTTNTLTMPAAPAVAVANYIPGAATASLPIRISLQGRPAAPNAQWATPLTVQFFTPGNTTAAYTYSVTTDNTGNTNMSLTGLVPGNYDVRVKNIRSLARKVNNVAIVSGANPLLNMGLLREGDTNNDNVVNLTDFSLLSATFGKCTGALGFDDRADYNRDTCVTIADFSLLSSNYGVTGQ